MAITEEAVQLKEQGNKAFKGHDWITAISFYTQAIDLYDKEASFYTNRAQVSHATRDNLPSPLSCCHTLFDASNMLCDVPQESDVGRIHNHHIPDVLGRFTAAGQR
jgi:hypothetical protein